MPLQNRVDPFGHIHAVPQRGLFMGNRGGRIHDPITKLLLNTRHASRRWIICRCVYKDWQRTVMGAGYTELFFVDEVTALASGHRPCALCRPAEFQNFRHCTMINASSADGIDRILHAQRRIEKPNYDSKRAATPPDGIMIAVGDIAYAKRGDAALRWSFDGYFRAGPWADIAQTNPKLLTPPLTITALQNGYAPIWHPSATI